MHAGVKKALEQILYDAQTAIIRADNQVSNTVKLKDGTVLDKSEWLAETLEEINELQGILEGDKMAKWCDEGETSVGNIYLKNATQVDKYLGLYMDVAEPGETATLATITEVTVAFGYARIQLGNADWTEDGAIKGKFSNLEKTFTANGGAFGAVTGSFIATTASGTGGKLLAVEHFADGVHNIADGSSQKVTPILTIT